MEPVSVRRGSSIVDKRDVPGQVTQSLAAAPYRFPLQGHCGEGRFDIQLKKLEVLGINDSEKKPNAIILTTGEKTSSKSTLYCCCNPFTTILAMYLGLMESVICLRR